MYIDVDINELLEEDINLFIVYASKDTRYKSRILKSIAPALKSVRVNVWHDEKIPIGKKWEEIILINLEKCNVFIFIVSSHFFASNFIQSVEFKHACEKSKRNKALIFPFILDSCDWQTNNYLKEIQAFPKNGICFLKQKNKSESLATFTEEIINGINQFKIEIKYSPPNHPPGFYANQNTLTDDIFEFIAMIICYLIKYRNLLTFIISLIFTILIFRKCS